MVKQKKVGELERQVTFSFADGESKGCFSKSKKCRGLFEVLREYRGPFVNYSFFSYLKVPNLLR